jgi:ribose-phosphate pyrophosphokinase
VADQAKAGWMGNDSSGGELKVHAFADGAAYARQIARRLEVGFAPIKLHRFPDGESLVRVAPSAGRHAVLVRTLSDPNSKIFDTLLAADALRHAGANRVSLIAPYLAYMRQDKVFHRGEPISQRVIGRLLGEAFDSVLTMEPHLHRVKSLGEVIPCEASTVAVASAVARWVKREARRCVVVGPDGESRKFVEAIARAAEAEWIVGEKTRYGDRRVKIDFPRIPGVKHAVIVDDIASSGVTLAAAVRELRSHRIEPVDAVVVHALFAPGAMTLIRRAGARRVVSCDTIAHPTNAIKTASLFAEALR